MNEPTPNRFERIAFQYCKIATLSLLCGRYVLPVAAILSALFFITAFVQGVRFSQCYLRYPLFIAGFWLTVAVAWLAVHFGLVPLPPFLKSFYGIG